MAHYLLQVTYAPEAWAALVDEPQSRTEAVQPAVEQLGGTVHSTWLAFGEYDVISIERLYDEAVSRAVSYYSQISGPSAVTISEEVKEARKRAFWYPHPDDPPNH